TALILAVYGENIEKIQLLLSAGADVNIKNRNGETILMTAIEKNNTEIVELLKSAGAKE
ncbi:MAG: ankyrin repeat domain-containing protein, partial [Elusimicrobiaceae bacterium]|nr:ankyrin repeat domain-containing protein [Elusimicrobiaceae bacterium]